MTKSFSTVVRSTLLSIFALAAAACGGDAEPSRFAAGIVRTTCGPVDEPAVQIRLSSLPFACNSTGARAPGVSMFAAPATLEPRRFDAAGVDLAQCDGDTCTEIESGFVEILTVEDERVELRWSLELPSGELDEGEMWVPRCEPVSPRCG